MDRDRLKAWLEAGLSLPQIGALTNRDSSTVGYWVQKHGLTANGKQKYAPRGGLTRDELQELVEGGATLQQMAEELDRSLSTIRHWLKKYGLRTVRRHENTERARVALEAGLNRFVGRCRRHGETEFLAFKSGRHRCTRCNSEAVIRRRRRVKEDLAAERGGRCAICGYQRYLGALQFHHVNRDEKEFAVSGRGVTRAIEIARREAEKCVLLCATCHAEVEAGVASLPDDIARPK